MSDFLYPIPRGPLLNMLVDRPEGPYSASEAKVSMLLDLDSPKGLKSQRSYAKIWGWSRKKTGTHWPHLWQDVTGWCVSHGRQMDSPLAQKLPADWKAWARQRWGNGDDDDEASETHIPAGPTDPPEPPFEREATEEATEEPPRRPENGDSDAVSQNREPPRRPERSHEGGHFSEGASQEATKEATLDNERRPPRRPENGDSEPETAKVEPPRRPPEDNLRSHSRGHQGGQHTIHPSSLIPLEREHTREEEIADASAHVSNERDGPAAVIYWRICHHRPTPHSIIAMKGFVGDDPVLLGLWEDVCTEWRNSPSRNHKQPTKLLADFRDRKRKLYDDPNPSNQSARRSTASSGRGSRRRGARR